MCVCVLMLSAWQDDSMVINVRLPDASIISMVVEPELTVKTLKLIIMGKVGIPRHEQRLMFRDVQLQSNTTLSENSIQDGDTITLLMDLSGGAGTKRSRPTPKDDVGHVIFRPEIKADDLDITKVALTNMKSSIDITAWVKTLSVQELAAIIKIFESDDHKGNQAQLIRLLGKFIKELNACEELG